MEFQKLIESRRSIRKYDGSKKVTKEQIETLIAAATEAPSWKNSETARYYCVLSDEMTKRVREECLPGFNRERSENAALLVTTFVHTRAGFDKEGDPDNEVGLGSLVMGIRDGEKLREVLEIPESEIVVSVIAVGYPAEAPARPKRRAVEDIAKFF